MRTLLISTEFPDICTTKILDSSMQVCCPPLAMVTVRPGAPHWSYNASADRNVREVTRKPMDWRSWDLPDDRAKATWPCRWPRQQRAAVAAGPLSSSNHAPELDLADFKILDEGEITSLFINDREGKQGPLQAPKREPMSPPPIPARYS